MEDKMDVAESLKRFNEISALIVKDLEDMQERQSKGRMNWAAAKRVRVNLRLLQKDVYQPIRKASHAYRKAYETAVK